MKTLFHILSFEWKTLWRSRILRILLLVVFGAGLYGIYFGSFEIDKQQSRIAEVQEIERQEFDSLLRWSQLDTTVLENKAKFQRATSPTGVGWSRHFTYYLTHDAPSAAGLCLGQRDLYPSYYGFNVGDLARQINTGELANPMKLLTGNFDLSYVFIFLLPLLIIALFYNLYAGEKEGGTLSMLQSQAVSIRMILFSKGLIRLLIIWIISFVLVTLGFLFQGISIENNGSLFIDWMVIIFGYGLFWVLLMSIVVWLRRSSALSAMMGLGVWILFTLINPALINLYVLANEPLPNRTDAMHAVRTLNDQVWENPKSFVWDQFYEAYPEYNDGDTTHFNKWYYASFTLIDQEANALNSVYEEQVAKRNAILDKWQWIAPSAMVHENLSRVTQTDRESHLAFVKAVHAYHDELKDLYYSHIFSGESFSREDLEGLSEQL